MKQYSKVVYLGCALDECLTGESTAMEVYTKITSILRLLHEKNKFMSKELRNFFCITLIQLHFEYACAASYPNLNKKYGNKLQVFQNKPIRFCLQLDNRQRIGTEHVDKRNWLTIDQRLKQCLPISAFTFFFEMCPQYITKIYKTSIQNNTVI